MNQPHPDDELLSASLDGEVDPGTIAHLRVCDACLARLDALDAVRGRVGAPPAPAPTAVADRSVAAATAAWREERAGGPSLAPTPAAGAGRAVDGDIVPLRRRTSVPAAGGRRRVPTWALGAAAAVVAALLAVPVLLGDTNPPGQTASAPTEDATSSAVSLDAGALDGGELGSLSDPATLHEALVQAVPGAGDTAAGDGAGDETTSAAEASPSSGDRATPSFAAGTTAAAPQARQAGDPRSAACRTAVRAEFGSRLGPLVYTAALRWQDTEAVVLAYRLADTSAPGPDHLALVMAVDDCRVLASQGF